MLDWKRSTHLPTARARARARAGVRVRARVRARARVMVMVRVRVRVRGWGRGGVADHLDGVGIDDVPVTRSDLPRVKGGFRDGDRDRVRGR